MLDLFNKINRENDNRWEIIFNLYSNFWEKNKKNENNIPKIIHQIWVGDKDLPKNYKEYIDTWKKHNPEWKHILWTNEMINNQLSYNKKIYSKIKNNGQKADFLRYYILFQFGGVYVDTDFECLKSFNVFTKLNFFTSISYSKFIELYIGLIGSSPQNPIIGSCINNIEKNGVFENNWEDIFNTTGNYFFTRQFFENIENLNNTVVFPLDYFYPFPNTERKNLDRNFRLNYITEYSYAIHHWGVSWLK